MEKLRNIFIPLALLFFIACGEHIQQNDVVVFSSPPDKMLVSSQINGNNEISENDFFDKIFQIEKINEDFILKYKTIVLQGIARNSLERHQQADLDRFEEAGGTIVEMKNADENAIQQLVSQSKNAAYPDYKNAISERIPDDNRFSKHVLHQRFNEPMELAVMSNGNVLIVERKGGVKMYDAIRQEVRLVGQIPANDFKEDGLLGIALDPDFDKNHWIYLFYSPIGEDPVQFVSRFDFRDTVVMASEKVLLKIKTQRKECCHSAGSLEFGPKGNLWISVGDNTNPFESNGYNPIDERPGRYPFDAQRSSGNTNDLRGKILRIKPEKDGTYSIPDGNLFPKDGSQGRPEIYIMGCRNPFRFAIDSKNYTLYWGEIGPDANIETEDRGPRGYDEFNRATGPGFYGWPYFIGNNKPYRYAKFIRGEGRNNEIEIAGSEIAFDPSSPQNNSPNNTGGKVLPPAQPAFIYYPYGRSAEFPQLGAGSRNAMAGPIYYSENYHSPRAFPSYFDGKPIFYDWMRNWVFLVNIDEEGKLEKLEPFAPQIKYNNLMDMEFGKDGSLYVLEYGTGWFLENPDSRLSIISYNPGNRPPEVNILADRQNGGVPLEVNFQARVKDHDGDDVTYKWWFDSEAMQSTEANPTFVFERAGRFQVFLKVKDAKGAVSNAMMEIQVGNEAPVLAFEFGDNMQFKGNKSFWWPNQSFDYQLTVSDKEDGRLGSGIAEKDVFLSIDHLAEGEDITEIAQGHQSGASAQTVENLIEQSNCQSCHQEEEKLVGPGFMQVSEKYRNQPDAVAYLSQKILNGGSGVWGSQAMAAQAQLSDNEAERIARYIISLGKEKVNTSQPLNGHINTASYKKGTIVLEARYTDKGGELVGPGTTYKRIFLRYGGIIEAENFVNQTDAILRQSAKDLTPYVDNLLTGTYLQYKQIDLTSIREVQYIWQGLEGGRVEMHIDAVDGPLICSHVYSIENKNMSLSQPVQATEGFHDIFLVFYLENEGQRSVGNLDAIHFRP